MGYDKEKNAIKCKKWREKNKEYRREYERKYRLKNREHRNKLKREYREKYPERIRKYREGYRKRRSEMLNEHERISKWARRHLRNIMLKRDNMKCQDCGSKENLEMHEENYEYPQKLENLMTLCMVCHKKRHRVYAMTHTPIDPEPTEELK